MTPKLVPATPEEDRKAISDLRALGIEPPTCWGDDHQCTEEAVWVFYFAYEGIYCREHFNKLLLTFN